VPTLARAVLASTVEVTGFPGSFGSSGRSRPTVHPARPSSNEGLVSPGRGVEVRVGPGVGESVAVAVGVPVGLPSGVPSPFALHPASDAAATAPSAVRYLRRRIREPSEQGAEYLLKTQRGV
jgi:hypothetical protein